MLARKEAVHCKRHVVKTPEWNAKVAAALRGRTINPEARAKISAARRAMARTPVEPARTRSRPAIGKTDRFCGACGGPFTVSRPSAKQRFCSRACGYAQRRGTAAPNWRPDIPTFPCEVCGAPIRPASVSERRLTCSLSCKAIRQLQRGTNRDTDIERIMEAALIARGWAYQKQVGIPGCGVPDFLLAGWIVIYCDGDYWHRLPEHQERDARFTARLRDLGYSVYRFWGRDIKADIEACLDQVTAHAAAPIPGQGWPSSRRASPPE